jgi:hypothetical protein
MSAASSQKTGLVKVIFGVIVIALFFAGLVVVHQR